MSRVGTITVVDGPDRDDRFERAVAGHPNDPEQGQVFGSDREPGALQDAVLATPVWLGVIDPTIDELMTLWEATQYSVAVLVSAESSAAFEDALTAAVDEARRFLPAVVKRGFEVPPIVNLGDAEHATSLWRT